MVAVFHFTFSMLYFSKACVAQSTASCCISSDISAFLMTALRSAIFSNCVERKRSEPVGTEQTIIESIIQNFISRSLEKTNLSNASQL